jgi:hypothetical protein
MRRTVRVRTRPGRRPDPAAERRPPTAKGRRRRRRAAPGSTAFLLPVATLVGAGFLLDHLAIRAGIFLVVLGIIVFIVGAWLLVRPERGGEVGRPDMTPWGVG